MLMTALPDVSEWALVEACRFLLNDSWYSPLLKTFPHPEYNIGYIRGIAF
jgi:hypothetical protein